MNYQVKGTGVSIILHALVLTTLFSFSAYSPVKKKVMSLDFSIIEGKSQTASIGKNIVQEVKKVKAVKPKKVVPEKKKEPDKPEEAELKDEPLPEQKAEVADKQEPADNQDQREEEAVAETENVNSNSTTDNYAAAAKAKYMEDHFAYIKERIEKEFLYPRSARRRGLQGKVVVSFIVCSDGNVEDLRILESSGHKILDTNAISSVKRAAPFPPPPARAELIFPVIYKLG